MTAPQKGNLFLISSFTEQQPCYKPVYRVYVLSLILDKPIRNKAKNLMIMCNQLKDKYNGEVPDTMEELVTLAGAGRKTANVVLSNAFNVPSIAVDTHVFRVANRLALADSDDVLEVEKQLQKELPKKEWSLTHHLLIFHGRRCCTARNPKCDECPFTSRCRYYKENKKKLK